MVFRSSAIPTIPPSHIKTPHIRGAWTTAAPTHCEEISILGQRVRIGEETLTGYEKLLAVTGREGFARPECEQARTNATSALGEVTRLECERARTNATSAPRMRAGSHERNLKEFKRLECEWARTDAISQNASGLARMPPQTIRAPRMRAGTHKRHHNLLRQERWKSD